MTFWKIFSRKRQFIMCQLLLIEFEQHEYIVGKQMTGSAALDINQIKRQYLRKYS
jgi:hypothetical protein